VVVVVVSWGTEATLEDRESRSIAFVNRLRRWALRAENCPSLSFHKCARSPKPNSLRGLSGTAEAVPVPNRLVR
jgi:hypothetical protein